MKLGLGTVQFGTNYGITNERGQVPLAEVREILAKAEKHGFTYLDTAALYGTSEQVIGKCLPNQNPFKIITKTLSLNKDVISKEDVEAIQLRFEASLTHLCQERIYALLFHNPNDLLSLNAEWLFDFVQKLKKDGKVAQIGVSIYQRNQIEEILKRFPIDLLQFPVNVLDQRLTVDDFLSNLHQKGIELHGRSAFFQGILLSPLDKLPSFLNPLSKTLDSYGQFLIKNKMSRLEAALKFISTLELDALILGTTSLTEFEEIIQAWKKLPNIHLNQKDFGPFAFNDQQLLDPSSWPKVTAS